MTRIKVELAYALPHSHALRRIELDANSTIAEAIFASGIGLDFPEIDLVRNRVGIFGRCLTPEAPVRDGDRVEIYRPLTVDPKASRRRRAERARRAKK